jgi:hypothetical protein
MSEKYDRLDSLLQIQLRDLTLCCNMQQRDLAVRCRLGLQDPTACCYIEIPSFFFTNNEYPRKIETHIKIIKWFISDPV